MFMFATTGNPCFTAASLCHARVSRLRARGYLREAHRAHDDCKKESRTSTNASRNCSTGLTYQRVILPSVPYSNHPRWPPVRVTASAIQGLS